MCGTRTGFWFKEPYGRSWDVLLWEHRKGSEKISALRRDNFETTVVGKRVRSEEGQKDVSGSVEGDGLGR